MMAIPLERKLCTSCNRELEISYFGKRPEYRDGYRTQCNPCRSAKTVAYFKTDTGLSSRRRSSERGKENGPPEGRRREEVTLAMLNDCFTLDEANGLLYWKTRPDSHFSTTRDAAVFNTKWATKATGKSKNIPYMKVKIWTQSYLCHRIVYAMHHGLDMKDVPPVLDHKDGDPCNNRIGNLRPATFSQNGYNKGISCLNTSGFKGVSKKGNGYRAMITASGKQIYLGFFPEAELAASAYQMAAIKYHGEFARASA